MYFLYSLGGVTFNKYWLTLSILNCYSPNFQGFILMKNALNNQVGMLGDIFLWLVAKLKQGVIYFIKQALPPNISAGSVSNNLPWVCSLQGKGFRESWIFLQLSILPRPKVERQLVPNFGKGTAYPTKYCMQLSEMR